MKPEPLLLIASIIFILINTTYFWLGSCGPWVGVAILLHIPVSLLLAIFAIPQLYLIISRKHYNTRQTLIVLSNLVLITAIFIKPFGIINYEKYEGKNLFLAIRPINNNCMVSFMLKDDHQFKMRSSCIDFEEQRGEYSVKGDTILFHNNKHLDFAVITDDTVYTHQDRHYLSLFKDGNFADELYVAENHLGK